MIGSVGSGISSGSSSGISSLRAWGVSKDLAKCHSGTKQLAADRPDRSAQHPSDLCRGEFTKREEHDHLSLASGKAPDGSDEVGVDPGFGRSRRRLLLVDRPAGFPSSPRGPGVIPRGAQPPPLWGGVAGDRVPMRQGPGEGLGGGVLGRGPVEGAGQQGAEDRAAVVLVEQPERLQRVYGHALTSPSDSVPLEATGEANSCWARSGDVMAPRLGLCGGGGRRGQPKKRCL